MTPLEFLRAHPPFDRLGPELLREVEQGLEIAFRAKDERILSRGGPPAQALFVVRKGVVRLEQGGEVVQLVEEGEWFGFPSLVGKAAPHADVVAAEDTLLYQIPAALFDRLFAAREFAGFFLHGLGERLRRSAAARRLPLGRELATPVGRLAVSTPVFVPATTSVGEVARIMRDRGISSVLVDGDPPGILTDRDLRSRVLAEGRGAETTVGDVASRPLRSVSAESTLFETLVFMLEQHVHHAPVETAGSIVGVVTDTDLLRLYIKSPLYLLRHIEQVSSARDLDRFGLELAAMVESLLWGGLGAPQVCAVVSRLDDALVGRLARLAEAELGPPPVPYAWIVFGSEGRMEQALLTDQDNAIVYGGGGDEQRAEAYFATLAERVVRGLTAAGFPPCPGGFMATNWRRPLGSWVALFRGWIATPEPRALVEALNFFDFRAVHGALRLDALERVVQQAASEQLFLAHFARASVGLRPPLGAFRLLRTEEGGVDLKKGGLAPLVSLARLYALEARSSARSTLDRLGAASAAGTLSRPAADTLAEGFRFLLGLRLGGQLRALGAGEPVTNSVRLEQLSAVDRHHLKDVFVAIRDLQRATEIRYAVQRLA